jgi:hypothetical protein
MIDTIERINNSMKIIDKVYNIEKIKRYRETINKYIFEETIKRLINSLIILKFKKKFFNVISFRHTWG